MVSFTPFISKWVECMARLESVLSPWIQKLEKWIYWLLSIIMITLKRLDLTWFDWPSSHGRWTWTVGASVGVRQVASPPSWVIIIIIIIIFSKVGDCCFFFQLRQWLWWMLRCDSASDMWHSGWSSGWSIDKGGNVVFSLKGRYLEKDDLENVENLEIPGRCNILAHVRYKGSVFGLWELRLVSLIGV